MTTLSPYLGSPGLASSVGSSLFLASSQRSARSEATSAGSPALGKGVEGFAMVLDLDATEPRPCSDPTAAALAPAHTERAISPPASQQACLKISQLRIAPLPRAAVAEAKARSFAFTFACLDDGSEGGDALSTEMRNTREAPDVEEGELKDGRHASEMLMKNGGRVDSPTSQGPDYSLGAAAATLRLSAREPIPTRPATKRKHTPSSTDFYHSHSRYELDPHYEGPLTRIGHGGHGHRQSGRGPPERSAMGRALESRARKHRGSARSRREWDEPSEADKRHIMLDYGREERRGRGRKSEGGEDWEEGRRAKRARLSLA